MGDMRSFLKPVTTMRGICRVTFGRVAIGTKLGPRKKMRTPRLRTVLIRSNGKAFHSAIYRFPILKANCTRWTIRSSMAKLRSCRCSDLGVPIAMMHHSSSAQLQEEYGDRGLSIVGLAFELTGDFERGKSQIEKYKTRTGCGYPILIAGLSDKKKAAEKLNLLNEVKSYPTSIFLNSDNRPIAIHSGFSGPATGDAYAHLQGRFRKIIEEALSKSSRAEK